eukprot:jgi/Bigna1/138497/aug1.45_g13205
MIHENLINGSHIFDNSNSRHTKAVKVQLGLFSGSTNLVEPLKVAIEKGNLCMVRCLLERNEESLDILSARTPLDIAVYSGRMEIIKCLVEEGKADAESGLHTAAVNGRLDIVKYLVEKNADLELKSQRYTVRQSALAGAASVDTNNLEVLKYLVDAKALVNDPFCNEVPLTVAIASGNLEHVRFLLEYAGARTKLKNCASVPLEATIYFLLGLSVLRSEKVEALSHTDFKTLAKFMDIIKYLVESRKIDVDETFLPAYSLGSAVERRRRFNWHGNSKALTFLMWAIRINFFPLVKYLYEETDSAIDMNDVIVHEKYGSNFKLHKVLRNGQITCCDAPLERRRSNHTYDSAPFTHWIVPTKSTGTKIPLVASYLASKFWEKHVQTSFDVLIRDLSMLTMLHKQIILAAHPKPLNPVSPWTN